MLVYYESKQKYGRMLNVWGVEGTTQHVGSLDTHFFIFVHLTKNHPTKDHIARWSNESNALRNDRFSKSQTTT